MHPSGLPQVEKKQWIGTVQVWGLMTPHATAHVTASDAAAAAAAVEAGAAWWGEGWGGFGVAIACLSP